MSSLQKRLLQKYGKNGPRLVLNIQTLYNNEEQKYAIIAVCSEMSNSKGELDLDTFKMKKVSTMAIDDEHPMNKWEQSFFEPTLNRKSKKPQFKINGFSQHIITIHNKESHVVCSIKHNEKHYKFTEVLCEVNMSSIFDISMSLKLLYKNKVQHIITRKVTSQEASDYALQNGIKLA